MALLFFKLSKHAFAPWRAYSSAGFDLKTPISLTLAPGEIVKIPLDLQFLMPNGCYGRLATRSSMAVKGVVILGMFNLVI